MNLFNVLVLDDEKPILDVISLHLSNTGNLKVFKAAKPSEAFKIMASNHVDIAIIDIKLPEISGIEVLKKIKEVHPGCEVIMISGHGDMETVVECMRHGAIDYFSKPFELKAIQVSVERTMKIIGLQSELKQANTVITELARTMKGAYGQFITGKSLAMKQVMANINMFARSDYQPVLITGETGTGKEVAANHLHNLSSRRDKGFFAFNCAAIPELLFESELFGYKKGAFSGADTDKPGWFEIASNGTLFLDEIAEMPVNLQTKLLRVIEERKVWKLGAVKPIDVNVRIIAATNHNIQEAIFAGKFRKDLYYRLNIFEISLPPLRERREDIPVLAEEFMKYFSISIKKPNMKLAPGVLEALTNYDFPGNVRQLRNMMERAVMLANDNVLEIFHFLLPETPGDVKQQKKGGQASINQDLNLDYNEKYLIEKALLKTNNNKTKAAKELGITVQSLIRRLEKFNILTNA